MSVQTVAYPTPAPRVERPRPSAVPALDDVLAETPCPQRRAHVSRIAAMATFPITEVEVTETPYGVEVQLSGHGRMLMEIIP